MKIWKLLAAMAAVGVFSFLLPVLPAQAGGEQPAPGAKEEPKAEEPKAEEPADSDGVEQLKKLIKDLDQVTGKVEATEEDFKAVVKHNDAVEKLADANEKVGEAMGRSLKDAFDIIVKDEKYIAWAKENGLEPEAFLRKYFRVLTISMKEGQAAELKEFAEFVDGILELLEQTKEALGEEEYKKQVAEYKTKKEAIKSASEALKGIPGPTDAEKALLTKYADQLDLGMGGEEGSEGGSEGEGNGGKGN